MPLPRPSAGRVRRAPAAQPSPDEDLVRLYLREVGRHALLVQEQEVKLAKAIEGGEKAARRLEREQGTLERKARARLRWLVGEGQAARRTFVEANLRLVVSIARRYQGFGLPLLDLIQEGNLGLLHAVEKFDWRRGFKFSTYATWWIRQAITRGLADRSRTIRLPVHVTEALNRLRRAEAELLRDLGREPTDGEVAAALDVDVEHLQSYRRAALDPLSLSKPLGEDGDTELQEFLEDETCVKPLEEAVRARTADELRHVLASLGAREQRVIELRFGLADGRARTLEEVGHEFRLTRERIRQIEAKALAKLRHPAGRDLRAFTDEGVAARH